MPIWCPQKEIQDQLFTEESGTINPMMLEYFDLPLIHDQTIQGQNFIEKLAGVENTEIF